MEVCHVLVDKRLVVVDVSPWADADALQPSLQGQNVIAKSFFFQKEVEDTFMDSPSLTKNCPSLTASPSKEQSKPQYLQYPPFQKNTIKATLFSISTPSKEQSISLLLK